MPTPPNKKPSPLSSLIAAARDGDAEPPQSELNAAKPATDAPEAPGQAPPTT